jgi:uncharacterized protein
MTPQDIQSVFAGLESGDGSAFFVHVADDVNWIVEGTHPLAGHYYSKEEFRSGTFAKLGKILPEGTQLRVENVLISDPWAIVELQSLATAKNGMRFDNCYCWLTRFQDENIVEVRAYLDSAMVQRLFDENPI